MSLHKSQDRLQEDPRILIIDKQEDAALFSTHARELNAANIHILAFPYPEELDVLQECALQINTALRNNIHKFEVQVKKDREHFKEELKSNYLIDDNEDISQKIETVDIAGKPNTIISNVTEMYKMAAQDFKAPQTSAYYQLLQIAINNTHTLNYHRDFEPDICNGRARTVCFAFNKGGVVINSTPNVTNMDECSIENDIQIPEGWVAIMDETVWHRTPHPEEYQKYTDDDPRVCTII